MRLLDILLGGPVTLENGHEVGCGCQECRDNRQRRWKEIGERRKRGEKGDTLFECIAEAFGGAKPPKPSPPSAEPSPVVTGGPKESSGNSSGGTL